MRGDYLATESTRDTSCCVGSLNNSGITVKGMRKTQRVKSQSASISWDMPFEDHSAVQDCGRWLDQREFGTHGRGLFFPYNAKRKEISASRELEPRKPIILFLFFSFFS